MKLSIFWHQETEIVLFEKNHYSALTGVSSMLRATDFLNESLGAQHLQHHFMSTYIKHLKSIVKNPVEVKYESDFKFSDWFGSSPQTDKPSFPTVTKP